MLSSSEQGANIRNHFLLWFIVSLHFWKGETDGLRLDWWKMPSVSVVILVCCCCLALSGVFKKSGSSWSVLWRKLPTVFLFVPCNQGGSWGISRSPDKDPKLPALSVALGEVHGTSSNTSFREFLEDFFEKNEHEEWINLKIQLQHRVIKLPFFGDQTSRWCMVVCL